MKWHQKMLLKQKLVSMKSVGSQSHLKSAFVDSTFFTRIKDDQYQSTTGCVIYTYGDLVEWLTRKQSRRMMLMAASKYVALNDATQVITFIQSLK